MILVEALDKIDNVQPPSRTFPDLILYHNIKLLDLAKLARVPFSGILRLQFRFSVSENIAALVLDVLSELTEVPYNLNNVSILTHALPDDLIYIHA